MGALKREGRLGKAGEKGGTLRGGEFCSGVRVGGTRGNVREQLGNGRNPATHHR